MNSPLVFRRAVAGDLRSIFLMGYDTWGCGLTLSQYLAACEASPKYRTGTWYVLEDSLGERVSSVIVYPLQEGSVGLGSLSTDPRFRKKGYANLLLQRVLGAQGRKGIHLFFLYADIDSRYYEKLGFQALPEQHQNYLPSVCMVKGVPAASLSSGQIPPYF